MRTRKWDEEIRRHGALSHRRKHRKSRRKVNLGKLNKQQSNGSKHFILS